MNRRYSYLVNRLPEVYQPIVVNGNVVYDGLRDNCFERFDAIKKYIKPGSTVLDVGSNSGFFSIELARLYPDSVFVSLEASPRYVNIQKQLIKDNNISNVVLIQGPLTYKWLEKAFESCVYFDCVLLLSVIHHFESPHAILTGLSRISKSIVMEIPSSDELHVCGKDRLTDLSISFLSSLKEKFDVIPYTSHIHTDLKAKRNYYYSYDSNYHRNSLYPYIGYPYSPRNYTLQSTDKGLTVYKGHLSELVVCSPGINYADASKLGNVCTPGGLTIMRQLFSDYYKLKQDHVNLADLRYWNVLLTGNSAKFIDYTYTDDLNPKLRASLLRDMLHLARFIAWSSFAFYISRLSKKAVAFLNKS